MLIRLALESDFARLVEMCRSYVEETNYPHNGFDARRAQETFRSYLDTADPTIFVAEEMGKVAGLLVVSLLGYRMAYGLKAICEVLYVDPAYRGSRAATDLLKHAESWASRLGAQELVGGVENNYQPERTAKLLERKGFVRMGFAMTRRL